jgi:hypothetical protein
MGAKGRRVGKIVRTDVKHQTADPISYAQILGRGSRFPAGILEPKTASRDGQVELSTYHDAALAAAMFGRATRSHFSWPREIFGKSAFVTHFEELKKQVMAGDADVIVIDSLSALADKYTVVAGKSWRDVDLSKIEERVAAHMTWPVWLDECSSLDAALYDYSGRPWLSGTVTGRWSARDEYRKNRYDDFKRKAYEIMFGAVGKSDVINRWLAARPAQVLVDSPWWSRPYFACDLRRDLAENSPAVHVLWSAVWAAGLTCNGVEPTNDDAENFNRIAGLPLCAYSASKVVDHDSRHTSGQRFGTQRSRSKARR